MESLKKTNARLAIAEEAILEIQARIGPGPSEPVDTSSDTPQPDRNPSQVENLPKAERAEAARAALEAQELPDAPPSEDGEV